MDEKRNNFGGLPQQETGTAVHVFIGVSGSMHDSERQLGKCIFATANNRLLHLVDCVVRNLYKLRILLSEARISELAAIAALKSRQDIWKTYFY